MIAGLPLLGVTRFGPIDAAELRRMAGFRRARLGRLLGLDQHRTQPSRIRSSRCFSRSVRLVLAGYVSADPEPRYRLIMNCYVVGCLIATAAAFAGYFQLIPSAYDLFTNFGRARGTFKDPNVLGAALAPAIVYTAWIALRHPMRQAMLAAVACLPLCLALLLSFSRGAWASTAFSLIVVAWLGLVTTRRTSDMRRLTVVAVIGVMTLGAGHRRRASPGSRRRLVRTSAPASINPTTRDPTAASADSRRQ